MDTLKDLLKPFNGKKVGAQVVAGGQLVAVDGTVRAKGDEVVLVRERRMISGQPQPTPQGIVTPKQYVPETLVHIGDVPAKDVFIIEVAQETVEEAKEKLESKIETPPSNGILGIGG